MARKTYIDDMDAITPCPIESTTTTTTSPTSSRNELPTRSVSPSSSVLTSSSSSSSLQSSAGVDPRRSRRRESIKVLEEEAGGDPERLWRRMLALQRRYGCYNSARMSAALSSGDISLLRPSKACLDMLNEYMAAIPDESESSSLSAAPNEPISQE